MRLVRPLSRRRGPPMDRCGPARRAPAAPRHDDDLPRLLGSRRARSDAVPRESTPPPL